MYVCMYVINVIWNCSVVLCRRSNSKLRSEGTWLKVLYFFFLMTKVNRGWNPRSGCGESKSGTMLNPQVKKEILVRPLKHQYSMLGSFVFVCLWWQLTCFVLSFWFPLSQRASSVERQVESLREELLAAQNAAQVLSIFGICCTLPV